MYVPKKLTILVREKKLYILKKGQKKKTGIE